MIQCSRVNAHWFRHFLTDSADQDIQLNVDKVPADIVKIVGFQHYHNNDRFDDKRGIFNWGKPKRI